MKEIRIDGVIGTDEGEVSAAWLRSELPANGTDPIRVSVHSEGGSVFEGFACHDVLAEYKGPKIIAVESTAFSIASFIAMAGDEIEMSPNAYFMLHNPRINIEGDDEELAKKSGMISSLKQTMVNGYAQRTNKSADEIQAILKAETYFNATEAVSFGLADRITQKPIKGRVIARVESLPHGVATALFGAGSGGDNDSKKGKSMSESKPVAATVKEIKAAFPALAKKRPDFVVDCIEREMPLASVASAAAEEMMKENEELKAKVTALEEEMAKAKAKAEGDEDKPCAEGEDMPEEDDDEKKKDAEAKARARGAKPLAKGTSGRPSAKLRWDAAVESAMAKTRNNKPKAVALASRTNPGLREAMLAEVNAR